MATDEEFKNYNRPLIEEFRANAGKVEAQQSLLLLTSIGAKSGKEHTTPLTYSLDGDRIIVVAAAAGSPRYPAWYYNLLSNPIVTVELGGESQSMRAIPAEGDEYARLYEQHTAQFPFVVDMQAKVKRKIPFIILEQIN